MCIRDRDLFASPTRRPNAPARVVDELAVDAIAARVVAVDMACVFVAARAALTRADCEAPRSFQTDIFAFALGSGARVD